MTSDADQETLLGGMLLGGRYRIGSRLGAGGMATVYLAADQNLEDKVVVVKVPHRHVMQQADFRERFRREITSLIRMEHPQMLRILDQGTHRDVPYIVIEYKGGGDLSDRIAEAGGSMSPEQVMQWLPGVADALDYAFNSRHLVHRDIKPDNILFDENGHVFVSDFGIATVIQSADVTTQIDAGRLTQEEMFVGSPGYAPPEALQRELSGAYDQYSLGVTVYEALSGARPFTAPTAWDILMKKTQENPAPLEGSGISPAVAAVVMRSLERNRADRYESCAAFARAFCDAARQPDATTSSSWRWWAAAGVASAALVAVLYLGLRSDDAPTPVATDRDGREDVQEEGGATAEVDVVATTDTGSAALSLPPADLVQRIGSGSFEAGSDAQELREALRLCRAYSTDCEAADYADESPLRPAQIPALDFDAAEVTNGEFAAFVRDTDYETSAERHMASYDELGAMMRGASWKHPKLPADPAYALDRPVVHVSYEDAEAYCRHYGKRLPSEDEWEFAARGSERRVFPWGESFDDSRLNWYDDTTPMLERSGSHVQTPEGLYDLAGSTWEWTSSEHRDGGRILKGGSWRERNPANLRAAARLVLAESDSSWDVGFRCVAEP